MRGPKPTPIQLSDRQRGMLEKIVRRQTSTVRQVRRAKLILSMGEGNNNRQTADLLGVHRETVIAWRRRWLEAVPELTATELSTLSDQELLSLIEAVLMDEARAGAPLKFSALQVTQMIAIACCDPQASERPISHWSGREIREEAIQRGIIEEISERSVQRFLKRSRLEAPQKPLLAQCQSSKPRAICSTNRSCM